jgi:ElaB/YqjD/DUF883 family membrane-anchored ribosome-binding protein
MMDRAVTEFDRARDRMAGDLRTMITDSEDLLRAAATVSSEGFSAARTRLEEKLRSAKARPWTAVGIAIGTGALIGFLAAKR